MFLRSLFFIAFFLSSAAARAAGDSTAGVQLFDRGRLTEARQFFESFVEVYPADAAGAFYLGRIAFDEEQYDRAVEWFEKAAQLVNGNAEYHLWLGRAYGHKAKRATTVQQPFLARKVKAHFEKAVALEPDNIEAREALMEYYMTAPGLLGGSKEKAREQAQEIRRRDVHKDQVMR